MDRVILVSLFIKRCAAYMIVFWTKAQSAGFGLQGQGQCSRIWEQLGDPCPQTLVAKLPITIRGIPSPPYFKEISSGFHTNP